MRLLPTPDGSTGSYFDDGPARQLGEVLEDPGSACWYTDGFVGLGEGALVVLEDVDDLVRESAAVALGVVSGIQGGVHEVGGPGLLIQVEVRRWLKKQPDYLHSDIVHFYYPRGQFRVGDVSICTQARGFPEPPTLDAEILLFPKWLGDDPLFLPVSGWRVAFDTSHGVRVPDRLRQLPEFRTLDFSQLKRWVREAAQSTGSEEGAR